MGRIRMSNHFTFISKTYNELRIICDDMMIHFYTNTGEVFCSKVYVRLEEVVRNHRKADNFWIEL